MMVAAWISAPAEIHLHEASVPAMSALAKSAAGGATKGVPERTFDMRGQTSSGPAR